MTSYINNNDKDKNARAIINHFNSTERVRPSTCGGDVDTSSSDGFMTLSDIRIQDFVGYRQGAGLSADKDSSAAVSDDSGSLSHWTDPPSTTTPASVERAAAGGFRKYNFLKEIEDRSIDMLEPAKILLSHQEREEYEDEDEEEEDTADTAPILACTPRVVTPHRLHAWTTSSKATRTNNKNTGKSSERACENKTRGWTSDNPRNTPAFSGNNNNCSNSKNISTGSRCVGGDPKERDGPHRTGLQLPPPLISNHPHQHHQPQNNLHSYLEESRCLIPEEVFAADVCFVNSSHQAVSSHNNNRPTINPNFGIVAATGSNNIYQNHGHGPGNLIQNGTSSSAASSTFLNSPTPSSPALVVPTSLFDPTTTAHPSSAVVPSSSSTSIVEGSEGGGLRSGDGRGGDGQLPPTAAGEDSRRTPAPTTCSFAHSGAGSATTSSSLLPAWSSPPHAMGDHCHPAQASNTKVDKLARNQLIAVSVLCAIFMSCEIVGGILSNSLALFTDVLHLGSDLISFFIGILALSLAAKPPTESMSFGYHRIEVLGAVVSVLSIWLVTGILCYIAIERIMLETYKDVRPDEMLITASLGVLFNVVMGCVLHLDFCCKSAAAKAHGHSHGHSSNGHSGGAANSQKMYQRLSQEPTENTPAIMECQSKEKPHKNVNIRAAIIHVIGDIIQSTGVVVAALIIKFTDKEAYRLADPICTFVFSIIVLFTTVNVLRDTIFVIMEGVPREINYKKLRAELETLDHVKMVHSLCVWSLTLNKNAMSVHLAIDDVADTQVILEAATALLRKQYNFHHTTIQVERYIPNMSQCPECLMPA